MDHLLSFRVTLCLGRGDGGDVMVRIWVTDDMYEKLLQLCREGMADSLDNFEEFEALCDEIRENAASMNEFYNDDEEEINYDEISYIIYMADEIVKAEREERRARIRKEREGKKTNSTLPY